MCVLVVAACLRPSAARAKNPEEPETAIPVGSDMDFLDHDKEGPLWLGGEVNSILQVNPSFPAKGTPGPHSFGPKADAAISGLATVFTGCRPGGSSCSVDTSRSPKTVSAIVRGMGVAVMTK